MSLQGLPYRTPVSLAPVTGWLDRVLVGERVLVWLCTGGFSRTTMALYSGTIERLTATKVMVKVDTVYKSATETIPSGSNPTYEFKRGRGRAQYREWWGEGKEITKGDGARQCLPFTEGLVKYLGDLVYENDAENDHRRNACYMADARGREWETLPRSTVAAVRKIFDEAQSDDPGTTIAIIGPGGAVTLSEREYHDLIWALKGAFHHGHNASYDKLQGRLINSGISIVPEGAEIP